MKTLLIWTLTIITFADLHAQFIKEPYLLYTDGYATMKVVFQTKEPGVYIVSYGLTKQYEIGAAQISQQKKGENENIFEYTFKYLQPNSTYYFRITDKSKKVSFEGDFHSAPKNNNEEFSFLFAGNTYKNKKYNASLKSFSEKDEKFKTILLHTGNLLKTGKTEKGWKSFSKNGAIGNLKLPVIACIGQNEINKSLFKKYLSYSYPFAEDCFYTCFYGNIKFIVLDQFASLEKNSKQYNWLNLELSADHEYQKVILAHSLPFNNTAIFSDVNTLFESKKVKVMLCNNLVQNTGYKQIGRVHYVATEYKQTAAMNKKSEKTFLAVKVKGQTIFIERINKDLKVIESFKL